MSSEKPILEIDNLVVDYETEDGVVHTSYGMNDAILSLIVDN